jgi:hypothetical protein
MSASLAHGGNELAEHLNGRRVFVMSLADGHIYLKLEDGSWLTITGEYGASLSLTYKSFEEAA